MKKTTEAEEQPLRICVTESRLVISIGLNRLNGNDCHPFLEEMKIVNLQGWGDDIRMELEREISEQGNTILCDALDQAMLNAVENGSINVEE